MNKRKTFDEALDEMNRNCDGAYGTGKFPPEVKAFHRQEILKVIDRFEMEEVSDASQEWDENQASYLEPYLKGRKHGYGEGKRHGYNIAVKENNKKVAEERKRYE